MNIDQTWPKRPESKYQIGPKFTKTTQKTLLMKSDQK